MTKQETILKGILNNERCNICSKKINDKCLTCILENRIAGYCIEHHGIENFHKPTWIGVFE